MKADLFCTGTASAKRQRRVTVRTQHSSATGRASVIYGASCCKMSFAES
jgi:hypothetical protein